MNNKIYKILSIVLYVVSFFILLFCIKVRSISNIYISTNFKLLLYFISCVLIYISGLILVKKLNYNKKVLKINLIVFTIIYTIIICIFTLFDELYGRNGLILIEWNKDLLDVYSKYSLNLVPFDTIKLFTYGYINEIVSFKNFAINIFGNLCVFMPYGIFLPLIFKNMRKYYKFLMTMIFIVIAIELLQFVTMSGSCDIDDLILNVLGASIVYFIFKIKCINKFIHKIFLFE